jgi:hypothetical protein
MSRNTDVCELRIQCLFRSKRVRITRFLCLSRSLFKSFRCEFKHQQTVGVKP